MVDQICLLCIYYLLRRKTYISIQCHYYIKVNKVTYKWNSLAPIYIDIRNLQSFSYVKCQFVSPLVFRCFRATISSLTINPYMPWPGWSLDSSGNFLFMASIDPWCILRSQFMSFENKTKSQRVKSCRYDGWAMTFFRFLYNELLQINASKHSLLIVLPSGGNWCWTIPWYSKEWKGIT